MKRTPVIAAAAVIAVAATAVLATAHDRDGTRGYGGPVRGAEIFERFDINTDGQITREEIAAAAAAHFTEADGNGDGQLSTEELATFAEARQAERRAHRIGDRVEWMIKRHDADDNGMLSLDEMTADASENRMKRLFKHLDADNDGIITKAEAEAMQGDRGNNRGGRRHGQRNN